MTDETFTLTYILGTGHCGSTLLSMLLNGHSRMLGMSALRKIDGLLTPESAPEWQPNPLEGDLWRRVRDRYEHTLRRPFDQISIHHPTWKTFSRWSREQVMAWAGPCADLLACVAAESGRDLLIDSSKSWQQLYLLKRSGLMRIKVIHALRDGRGVLYSYQRKYQRFRYSFGQWAKPTVMAVALRPLFSSDDWFAVRYEDLASAPEQKLREICRFLGAEFEPDMLRFRQHAWFGILGNRMARSGSEEICLDEKWKQSLPQRDRLLFDLLAGPLNRYFGYGFRGTRL